jgi:DNA-binding NtrC family response regulator
MINAKVLFVDDEEDFANVVAERLRSRGIAVDTVTNGPDGIAKVRQQAYDAVILDLAMPGMDVIETMQQMLQHDSNLQIIILTGQGSVAAGVDAMKKGATDFLEKPADIDVLLGKLSDAQQKRLAIFEQDISEKMSDILRKKGW